MLFQGAVVKVGLQPECFAFVRVDEVMQRVGPSTDRRADCRWPRSQRKDLGAEDLVGRIIDEFIPRNTERDVGGRVDEKSPDRKEARLAIR